MSTVQTTNVFDIAFGLNSTPGLHVPPPKQEYRYYLCASQDSPHSRLPVMCSKARPEHYTATVPAHIPRFLDGIYLSWSLRTWVNLRGGCL